MSAIYGRMANLAKGAGSSVARTASAKGVGAGVGSIPSAVRWGYLSLAPHQFNGMGEIGFSVGPAVEHSGAAYGLTGVGASDLTERTARYGQHDLRGRSFTYRPNRPAPAASRWEPPQSVKNKAATPQSNPLLVSGIHQWGLDNADTPGVAGGLAKGAAQNPPEELFRPSGAGQPYVARPLWSPHELRVQDAAESAEPLYEAPRGRVGRGPKT